ncbi:50S ribosomal protein L9 [Synergistaceae bacterium OttesenSCG-928-D05]|nr:50S ribosomal protein L9 [Synergistaceae bacterium OttesenSCG-928-D05]
MKVILKQDVAKIGKKGEMLDVSDGYGRNFLIARGLAEEATQGKIRELEEIKKNQKVKDDKKLKIAEDAKKKIGGKVITLKVNAGEGGKLFGSVTTAQVADAIKTQYGVSTDKKEIRLDDAVKQTGSYPVKVKLYTGVEAELTLKVEAE